MSASRPSRGRRRRTSARAARPIAGAQPGDDDPRASTGGPRPRHDVDDARGGGARTSRPAPSASPSTNSAGRTAPRPAAQAAPSPRRASGARSAAASTRARVADFRRVEREDEQRLDVEQRRRDLRRRSRGRRRARTRVEPRDAARASSLGETPQRVTPGARSAAARSMSDSGAATRVRRRGPPRARRRRRRGPRDRAQAGRRASGDVRAARPARGRGAFLWERIEDARAVSLLATGARDAGVIAARHAVATREPRTSTRRSPATSSSGSAREETGRPVRAPPQRRRRPAASAGPRDVLPARSEIAERSSARRPAGDAASSIPDARERSRALRSTPSRRGPLGATPRVRGCGSDPLLE
jgi:hypothetical protein